MNICPEHYLHIAPRHIDYRVVSYQRFATPRYYFPIQKANRLDSTEAELKSVRQELAVLKQRDHQPVSSSENTIEKLTAENLSLQNEVNRAKELELELDNNRQEVSKLKSENERHVESRTALEQRDKELQKKLQHAALKERAGRLKMEVSAKRALGIARKAVDKLNAHEKKHLK